MEFWKLNLKEIGKFKIIWELEFWKLNLKEIEILKIIWELGFWKLNLGIGVLEIKFERNWNFEKLFENESFEIIWELELWKLFEKLEFGKLSKYQETRKGQVAIGSVCQGDHAKWEHYGLGPRWREAFKWCS